MNRILLTAALLLALLPSCNRVQGRFTVKGGISDSLATLPGSIVRLYGPDGPVDSAKVKGGAFSFSGEADSTVIYTVTLDFPGRNQYDDRFTARFVPEARTIHVDLDYPATVTGSPLTDAINAFQEKVMEIYFEKETEIAALSMGFMPEAADSVYSMQLDKIVALSRETYLANTGNALGLEAFSLLVTELGKDELEELAALGGELISGNPGLMETIASLGEDYTETEEEE